MSLYHDVIEALTPLVEAFDRLGITYYIGGSVSSSLHGLARQSQDVDVIADVRPDQVHTLVQAHETRLLGRRAGLASRDPPWASLQRDPPEHHAQARPDPAQTARLYQGRSTPRPTPSLRGRHAPGAHRVYPSVERILPLFYLIKRIET